MSLLRGHFAMTLIASVPDGDAIQRLDDALADLRSDGLTVAVFEVADQEAPAPGVPARVSVHGADRPGIVRAATEQVVRHGGNITDLSTRLGADLYVLSADVTFPPGSDVAAIGAAVREQLADVGVVATVSPVDEDLL